MRDKPIISLLEVIGVYSLIFSVIWLAQDVPWRPPLLVAGLALYGVCFASNRWHGDSIERIGLAPERFRPCLRLTVKIFAVPLAALAIFAATKPLLPWPKLIFGIFGYPLWAFAQEYALLSFLSNRLEDGLGRSPWRVALMNGALFSLVHAPNPILMGVCAIGGVLFTWIFQRERHLIPISLAHAATGFLLSIIFQGFYPAMMIGPAYIKWSRLFVYP